MCLYGWKTCSLFILTKTDWLTESIGQTSTTCTVNYGPFKLDFEDWFCVGERKQKRKQVCTCDGLCQVDPFKYYWEQIHLWIR